MSHTLVETGKISEEKAKQYCITHGFPYLEASKYLQMLGVDFIYSDNNNIILVDAKNTFEIYFCNVYPVKDNKVKVSVRHPFKCNTSSDELWILDKFTLEWYYRGSRAKYISEFFINENYEKIFLERLFKIDGLRFENELKAFYFLKDFKEKNKSFLNNCFMTVVNISNEITMKAVKYKDKTYMESHGNFQVK